MTSKTKRHNPALARRLSHE